MYTKHKATSSNLKQILIFEKKNYILTHPSYPSNIHQIILSLVLWFWDGLALFDQKPVGSRRGVSPHRLDRDRIITVGPIRGISGAHRNHLAGTGDHLGPLAREPTKSIWEQCTP